MKLTCHGRSSGTHLQHDFIDSSGVRLKVERFVVMVAQISQLKYGMTYETQGENIAHVTEIKKHCTAANSHSLGLLSSTRSQAQRWSESMEMGFWRIQNLVLAF